MGIRTRMIVLISVVVALSAVLPAAVSLIRVRGILRTKTFEICRNLGNHISNLAREELLVDETYDGTHDAVRRLALGQSSDDRIPGLLDSYVVNFDGFVVSAARREQLGERVSEADLVYFRSLESLSLTEGQHLESQVQTLRFAYPVFVRAFNGQNMRVGTTIFIFDTDEVYRPVQDLTVFIVLVTVVLLFVGLLVAILTALYFARPIQVLTEGANRIGAGDLGHRIEIRRTDELGTLALNFNRMTAEIQDFTRNLEEKVQDRTMKLNRSLEETKALKEQQDGDYFLTSLLLNPFRRNENVRSDTGTEFVIDQKKKFTFRDWSAEIGGDYCITDTITLGPREYTVFLNADAMGKSIQGAGGALVLATVFQAFLARPGEGRHSIKRPELWLRDCYLALQNIFATFQGAMFVTMVMGLADRSGLVYYVNAEHPPCVLYRAGRASYVEQGLWLRKLGTPHEHENFRIRMLQLAPGDSLFVGSDGKDDILPNQKGLAATADGDWFLRHIELAAGDLNALLGSLKANGEVKDDISVLRLSFLPHVGPVSLPEADRARPAALVSRARDEGLKSVMEELYARAVDSEIPEELADLSRLSAEAFALSGKHEKARTLYSAYLLARPAADDVLLKLAELSLRLKQVSDAEDYAECLRLRSPENEAALILLAEASLRGGDLKRALISVQRAIDLAPDHPDVRRLYREVTKRQAPSVPESLQETVDPAELERLRANVERQFREENYLPAAAVCRQILALLPDDLNALQRLADAFLGARKYASALPLYNRVLFRVPKNGSARNNQAVVCAALGKHAEALAHLVRAVAADPNLAAARENLSQMEALVKKKPRGQDGEGPHTVFLRSAAEERPAQ